MLKLCKGGMHYKRPGLDRRCRPIVLTTHKAPLSLVSITFLPRLVNLQIVAIHGRPAFFSLYGFANAA